MRSAPTRPTVTAFITAYNEEARIGSALESLLAQTYQDFEILVVDDGSSDRTTEVVLDYCDDRVRLLRSGRIGRAAALALAASSARGRYLANLDADDTARPDRLAEHARFLDVNAEVAWVGGGEERVDSQRNEHLNRLYPESDAAIRRMAPKCIPYAHSAVTFRRALIDEGLNYDPRQSYLIDFEFFLRVARRFRVANLPTVLVTRRIRDESYFQSRFSRMQQNRKLALLGAQAALQFRLPPWYLAYPLARLGYPLIPLAMRRWLRAIQGIEESAA